MREPVLLDAGPLVALLDADDEHHAWAEDRAAEYEPPWFTCEAVLTEAAFLVQYVHHATRQLLTFLERGTIRPTFHLSEDIKAVSALMAKYADLPMSLADACLVRMAEVQPHSRVLTLDRHFRIYRIHGRKTVPVIMPD